MPYLSPNTELRVSQEDRREAIVRREIRFWFASFERDLLGNVCSTVKAGCGAADQINNSGLASPPSVNIQNDKL